MDHMTVHIKFLRVPHCLIVAGYSCGTESYSASDSVWQKATQQNLPLSFQGLQVDP